MHRAQIFQEFRIVLRRYPDYLTFPSPIVFSSLQFIHPFLSSPFFPPLPLPSLLFEFRLCIVRFSHFSERREEGRLLESTEDKSSLAAIFRAKYALERERERAARSRKCDLVNVSSSIAFTFSPRETLESVRPPKRTFHSQLDSLRVISK